MDSGYPKAQVTRSLASQLASDAQKQVEMYTSAWTVTHDPQYFHEPFKFRPERWIDVESTDVKEASQPFSLGPRGCLGRKYVQPYQ